MAKKTSVKGVVEKKTKPAKKPAVSGTSKKTSGRKKLKTSQKKKVSSTSAVSEKKTSVKKPKKINLKKQKKIEEAKQLAEKEEKQWQALHSEYKNLKAASYDMSRTFSINTPIKHKKFGWGFILSVKYNRLDVLFKEGHKVLISDFKG